MANAFYAARVWETGTLTATATVITLPNTAASISGDAAYRTFASAAPPTGSPVVATVAATTTGGAWEQSVWTYTSGSPGTLTRLTFLSSSTGAAINWSGVAASIMLDVPPPIVASAGTASAGGVSALNQFGILDASIIPGPILKPPAFMYPASITTGGSGYTAFLGLGNGFIKPGFSSASNGLPSNNSTAFTPFLWQGDFTIKKCIINIQTAGTPVSPSSTCDILVGLYEIVPSGWNLIENITSITPFNGAALGWAVLDSTLSTPTMNSFDLAAGVYVIGMMMGDATTTIPKIATTSTDVYDTRAELAFGTYIENGAITPLMGITGGAYNTTNTTTPLPTTIVSSQIAGNTPSNGYNNVPFIWFSP